MLFRSVVQQSAADACCGCQLVHLRPIEVFYLFVGQAYEALGVIIVPPVPVCLPEEGYICRLQVCQCGLRLFQGVGLRKGVCVADDKDAFIAFPYFFPDGGGTATCQQRLPAVVQPVAFVQL